MFQCTQGSSSYICSPAVIFNSTPFYSQRCQSLPHNKLFCHPINNIVISWNISTIDIHIQTLGNRSRICLKCLSSLAQWGPREETLKILRKSYLHLIYIPVARSRIMFLFFLHSYYPNPIQVKLSTYFLPETFLDSSLECTGASSSYDLQRPLYIVYNIQVTKYGITLFSICFKYRRHHLIRLETGWGQGSSLRFLLCPFQTYHNS